MKQIEPVTIWVNGESKEATQFSLISIHDDLETSANFYYQLQDESSTLASGNLGMSGQDYEDWGNQSGSSINEWAYQWAAGKLNLVIK